MFTLTRWQQIPARVLLLWMLGAGTAQAEYEAASLPAKPLGVRNLSPVVQMYGLPRMAGARLLQDGLELSFNIEAANNFQSELGDGTFAFFDGETYVASHRSRGVLGSGIEWGLEIPYVAHSSGGLDGVVDEFHELFGLPDGDRSLAPRNRLDYFISSRGTLYADFDDSRRSVGDIRGLLGYQILADERRALAVRGLLKLPTGEVEDLSGSEGVDVSFWGEYEQRFAVAGRDWILSLGGGFAYLDEGELIPAAQEEIAWFGHVGLQIPLHRRVAFIAQLDGHTDILDTGNPVAAEGGVLGTVGGRIGVTRDFWVDLAIVEDLDNESASDVVFQVLLGVRL